MMKVTFYRFSKRHNSTKIPTDAIAHLAYDFVWLQPTDTHNPTIRVVGTGTNVAWNYALIEPNLYDKIYYFVRQVRWINESVCEFTLSIDVLATYKNYIIGSTCMVEFSQSNFNSLLIDERLPVPQEKHRNIDGAIQHTINKRGYYFITTVSSEGTSYSAFTSTYASDRGTLSVLANRFNNIDPTDEIFTKLKDLFTNAYNTITEVYWLPVDGQTVADIGHSSDIMFGGFSSGLWGYVLDNPMLTETVSVDIPWVYTDWRNRSPFTNVELFLPSVGLVPVNPELINGATALNVSIALDTINGDLCYAVKNGLDIIGTFSANVKVVYPLAQAGNNIKDIAQGVGEIAVGLASKDLKTAAIGASEFASGIQSMVSYSTGMSGGRASIEISDEIACIVTSYAPTDTQVTTIADVQGRPTYISMRIQNDMGYVKTIGAAIDSPAFIDEKTEIESLLNGGVFIE